MTNDKVPENNPFKQIEFEGNAPEHLKNELVSEIETIRNTSVIVELYIGSFIDTIVRAISIDEPKDFKD